MAYILYTRSIWIWGFPYN